MNRHASRPPWLIALLLVVGPSAAAQGVVTFSNNFVPAGQSRRAFITDINGNLVPKGIGRVQFLTPNGLILTPNGELGVPLILDGLFVINDVVIPGTQPGDSVTLIVRAWNAVDLDTTFATAEQVAWATFTVGPLRNRFVPAATLAQDSDFSGLTLLPLEDMDEFRPRNLTISVGSPGQLTIQADGSEWRSYSLHVSTDLTRWRQLDDVFPITGSSNLEWVIPEGSSPLFFRVSTP